MRRRDFIKGITGSAAGWPIALHAQSASAMQRVGWLNLFREDDPFVQGRAEAVREDLAKAGLIDAHKAEAIIRIRIIRAGRDDWLKITKADSFDAWQQIGAALAIGK